MNAPPVIGLLGGIGSGKSAVARILSSLGCVVSDADRHVHEVLSDPTVLRSLRERWGSGVIDDEGAADRSAIASVVFSDASERNWLEGIIHPRVSDMREELFAAADPAAPALVIDAPLILEADLADLCDHLVFIDVPREMREARVMATRGWDAGELERRESAQRPLDEKRSRADFILSNEGDESGLRTAVVGMLGEIQSASG